MPHDRMQRAARELLNEVRALEPEGPAREEMRRRLLVDLERFLATPNATTHEGLLGHLRDAIHTFESAHPELTATVSRFVDQFAAWNL